MQRRCATFTNKQSPTLFCHAVELLIVSFVANSSLRLLLAKTCFALSNQPYCEESQAKVGKTTNTDFPCGVEFFFSDSIVLLSVFFLQLMQAIGLEKTLMCSMYMQLRVNNHISQSTSITSFHSERDL